MRNMPTPSTSVLGVPIHAIDYTACVNRVEDWIRDNREQGTPTRYIATVNLDFIARTRGWTPVARRLKAFLNDAALCTADGMPLVWIQKCLGLREATRVTGIDLIGWIAARAEARGHSVFLLGGSPDANQGARESLQRRFPALRLAGATPGINPEPGAGLRTPELVARINRFRPDVLLIALGNPRQEFWFQENRDLLRVPVAMGVGGSFDFLSGRIARAPRWMQRSGLEWVFRLSREPRRLFQRYLRDALLLGPVLGFLFYRNFLKQEQHHA